HVGAKDRGTGKEQKMTITGGSALPKEDIDRMVKEAEEHAAEDKKRREEAETRNQAEAFVYSTEKLVSENKEKLPADVVTEVEAEDAAAVKTAHEKLVASSQKIGQALYASAEQEQAAGNPGAAADDASAAAGASSAPDEDVVDAEIMDDEDDKK